MNSVMEAIDDLRRAGLRLEANQGRIARRNARRSLLGAMRRLRKALNADFPQIDKPAASDDRCWFIECFEKQHREGVGKKSRIISDRWIIIREHFIVGSTTPKRLFDKNGTGRPLPLHTASKYAKRLRDKMTTHTFRIRKAGTTDVVMADVL